MVKLWKEKTNLLEEASEKIAGKDVNEHDEVRAQVTKARSGGTAKNTHEVLKNLLPKKKLTFK